MDLDRRLPPHIISVTRFGDTVPGHVPLEFEGNIGVVHPVEDEAVGDDDGRRQLGDGQLERWLEQEVGDWGASQEVGEDVPGAAMPLSDSRIAVSGDFTAEI